MTQLATNQALGSSVTVRLDAAQRDRLRALTSARQQSAQHAMREAIQRYLDEEEAEERFIAAALAARKHYRRTGEHITHDEFSDWVDQIQHSPNAALPACHR